MNYIKNKYIIFFSFSNFISAFGSGLILGKGIAIIDSSVLANSSILAYFVGSFLSLCFLKFPKKLLASLPQYFSFFSGIFSLFLSLLFMHCAFNGKISGKITFLFFLLLIFRFGFWFYSRAFRAEIVSKINKNIALIEIGNYVGTILGLILWNFIQIKITFIHAIVIDIFSQLIAGCLDIYVIKKLKFFSFLKKNHSIGKFTKASQDVNKFIMVLIFLTIGSQAILFSFLNNFNENFSSNISCCILFWGFSSSFKFPKKKYFSRRFFGFISIFKHLKYYIINKKN